MSDIESCFNCYEDTGKAGKGENSFYDEQGHGPYCDVCRDLWLGFSKEVRTATNDCWRILEGRAGLKKPDVGSPKIDMANLVQQVLDAATEGLRAENARLRTDYEETAKAYRDENQRANKNMDAYISAKTIIGEQFNEIQSLRERIALLDQAIACANVQTDKLIEAYAKIAELREAYE